MTSDGDGKPIVEKNPKSQRKIKPKTKFAQRSHKILAQQQTGLVHPNNMSKPKMTVYRMGHVPNYVPEEKAKTALLSRNLYPNSKPIDCEKYNSLQANTAQE